VAVSEKHDVIVIGAGIGGATCAALLARRGLRALLVDRNAVPGGKAMTVGGEGFRYELWPIAGGPSLNSQFARVLGELDMEGEVELLTPSRIIALMYRNNEGKLASYVGSAVPEAEGPGGALQLLGLRAEDLPEVLRFFGEVSQISPRELDELDDVTFAEFLSRYRLPQPLVSYLGMQANIIFVVPIDLLAASEMIRVMQDFGQGGAGRYHSGGFGSVAEVFCRGVERYGGRVLLDTRVERICVEEGRVTGVETNRGRFEAPIVVSNAGIQPTVLRLVGAEHFDRSYVSHVRGLVPSWAIMGIRYFLKRPYFEQGMYLFFSDDNYMDSDRFARMKSGWLPDELAVFNVVPSVYDASLAPHDKQCALIGTFCSPDPELHNAEALWNRLEETVAGIWPGLEDCVESKVRYGTRQVSGLTRDAVVPGQGGECIGLAQIAGQCGRHKPSARAPLQGLFYVGCDAGGYGCGTHQAADSGVNVADLVVRRHEILRSAF
jgi:phytoene dehydrogenase-like protein